MSERSRSREIIRKVASAGMVVALGFTAIACGETKTAGDAKLEACNDSLSPEGRGSKHDVGSTSELVRTANADIGLLGYRAEQVEGSINIANAKGVTTLLDPNEPEITVIKDSNTVQLKFNHGLYDGYYKVNFDQDVVSGDYKISAGSIACTENQFIYPNQVYKAIVDYTAATANIK